ncbi:MAG TPA: hypothetical protein PLF44_06330 [Candidatus Mcinerneyibacteriales bacterium]|nr:hypothetical protein [Candidatus Mcinerneyibacteriales bacterium]
MTRQQTPLPFLLLVFLMLLIQGAGKREGIPAYAYLERSYDVFPLPSGFRIRGHDLVKAFEEGTLFLYPLSGFHSMKAHDFQLLRIRLVRGDPETREIAFLNDEEMARFPYRLHEEDGLPKDLPFVTFHMEGVEAQMILELEWEFTVSDTALQLLFHTGPGYRDSSQKLTLHDPEACRRSFQGPLVVKEKSGTIVWTMSSSDGTALSPGEIPEVTLTLNTSHEKRPSGSR